MLCSTKKTKILTLLLICISLFGVFGTQNVNAATSTDANGVKLDLVLDKTIYSENEDISVSATVTNTNPTESISDISALSANPDTSTYTVSSGQTTASSASLASGESLEFNFVLSPISGSTDPEVPNTGVSSSDQGFAQFLSPAVGAIVVFGIVAIIAISKRLSGRRKIKFFVLALALVSSTLYGTSLYSTPSYAAPVTNSVNIQETANFVDGSSLIFNLDVDYDIEESLVQSNPPTISPVVEGSGLIIGGSGTPGATVMVRFNNTGAWQSSLVDSGGLWIIFTFETLVAGNTINAYQIEPDKANSPEVSSIVLPRT